ncbi:MAG TPA: rod shape-determining protein RodA [Polyangiaceae bacterium]|nr:rod shape-determining protein RodA [Polyangiaceae bacterium]
MAREKVSFRSGPQVDMTLLLVVVLITSIGLVNLYSATSAYVGASRHAALADVYVTQIYWIVIGFLVAMLLAAIDYRHLERIAPVLYIGGLLSLALLFVVGGEGIRGANRWLKLGSFSFQPSDTMKPLVALMIARHIQNDSRTDARGLLDLVVPFVIMGIPTVAVMLQPDLGTSLIYVFTTISMLGILRIRGTSVLLGLVLTLGGGWAMWLFGLKEYQRARITSFMNPRADADDTGWHALQSQTAIGNGGLTGEGFMQGTQNQFGFLPDQHSDFPFSVFAEEFGFVGCMVLLALYCFLSIWCIHIASQAKDRFGAALAIGCGSIIFWHAACNMGMSMGLLPVVGITLPLFSYGGSSVLTMMVCLGIMMSISMRR